MNSKDKSLFGTPGVITVSYRARKCVHRTVHTGGDLLKCTSAGTEGSLSWWGPRCRVHAYLEACTPMSMQVLEGNAAPLDKTRY